MQPFYLAALFLEQVHNLIQLSFCCLFSTSTFLPWAGSCCICLLRCTFINRCCQHKFGHRMNSAAMLSVVNRLVPIHFVAVFFMLVCFVRVRVCSHFYLAALFLEQVHNLIQVSFCCLFSTSTFLPWAGSCCIFLLTCSFINHCCQHKFGHRMNSAAMLSVVNRLVLIHFVAVFFMLVCFVRVRVCSHFYLAALFLEQVHNLIQVSFCCLFSTSTFLPWAGSCCIFLLTCSFINHCCQHKFGHRMDSAAMLSVVIRLVPSTL